MNQRGGIIFISCGQFTDEEKELGREIVELVRELTPYVPYFAEFQQSLEALTENIFNKLDEMVGFITVMHKRGSVFFDDPEKAFDRGSVWIEQEIAIASFLVQSQGKSIPIIPFIEEGIKLEGAREKLILNPVNFTLNEEVIEHLRGCLPRWQLSSSRATSDGESIEDIASRVRERGLARVPGMTEWGMLWIMAVPKPTLPRDARVFEIALARSQWYGKNHRTNVAFTSQNAVSVNRHGVESVWNVGQEPVRHLMLDTNGCFCAFQLLDIDKAYVTQLQSVKYMHESPRTCRRLFFMRGLESCSSPGSFLQRSASEPFGWCWTIQTSTAPSGRRSARSRRRSGVRPRP